MSRHLIFPVTVIYSNALFAKTKTFFATQRRFALYIFKLFAIDIKLERDIAKGQANKNKI